MAHKRVVSRHTFRRKARERESELEELLAVANGWVSIERGAGYAPAKAAQLDAQDRLRGTLVDCKPGLPKHSKVKVVKADADEAGRWLVVATRREVSA